MSNQFDIDDRWAIDDQNVFRPSAAEPEFGKGARP